jgi:hypothetical protein
LGYLGLACASKLTGARFLIFGSKFSIFFQIIFSNNFFIFFQKELFSNFPARRSVMRDCIWGGDLGVIWRGYLGGYLRGYLGGYLGGDI